MLNPIDLEEMIFPIRVKSEFKDGFWFGGSSRRMYLKEHFLVWLTRSEPSMRGCFFGGKGKGEDERVVRRTTGSKVITESSFFGVVGKLGLG